MHIPGLTDRSIRRLHVFCVVLHTDGQDSVGLRKAPKYICRLPYREVNDSLNRNKLINRLSTCRCETESLTQKESMYVFLSQDSSDLWRLCYKWSATKTPKSNRN
jgi:hypothetical protein